MKIYTKTGDQGKTSLLGEGRVYKDELPIEAYGTCDELNSFLGLLLSNLSPVLRPKLQKKNVTFLAELQENLFLLGARLSCKDEETFVKFKMRRLADLHCKALENGIDSLSQDLDEIKNFILPGGSVCSSLAHVCRTIARRLERIMVSFAQTKNHLSLDIELKYVNRLSDFFFMLARWLNWAEGHKDITMNLNSINS